jgi:hypothetical protein
MQRLREGGALGAADRGAAQVFSDSQRGLTVRRLHLAGGPQFRLHGRDQTTAFRLEIRCTAL